MFVFIFCFTPNRLLQECKLGCEAGVTANWTTSQVNDKSKTISYLQHLFYVTVMHFDVPDKYQNKKYPSTNE